MNIITDKTQLRLPSDPVANMQEGIDIARVLNYTLNRYNVKAKRQAVVNASKGLEVPAWAVGLSAPQIGILKQVCVIAIRQFRMMLINPRIVDHAPVKIQTTEGCLSFPGVSLNTYRWPWIEVECLNLGRVLIGDKDLYSTENMFRAVVAQHEIAHLSGLLLWDFESEDYFDWTK